MKRCLILTVLSLLFSGTLWANKAPVFWFSDDPPDKSLLKKMQRRHGGFVQVVEGIDTKQLWLKQGDSLKDSDYVRVEDGQYLLLDVQNTPHIPQPLQSAVTSIQFPMPDEGFYNGYFVKQTLDGDKLVITTAKAEVLAHNCRNGHKYDRRLVNPHQWTDAPLEIIRLRLPEEDFHTRIRSGTRVSFKILYQNKPLQGADVRLETNKGWIKTAKTDAEGLVNFQIIQDNFFDAEKAEKAGKKLERGHGGRVRINDTFLVTARYHTDASGVFQGKPYHATEYIVATTGRYYPQKLGSQSSEQALWFGALGMLVTGGSIYAYRRRRIKPFKEEQFDEH
jgi:hypothetical protein